MLNLFGKNVFARKRKAKVMPIDITSRIETLEERVVLAAVAVTFDSATGNLTINGTGAVDDVNVVFTGTNSINVTTSGATTFTLNGGAAAAATGVINGVTGNVVINLGNGNDLLKLDAAAAASLDSGNLIIDLGSADDTLSKTGAGALTVTGNVSVFGGTGNDAIRFGTTALNAAAGTFIAGSISVDAGTVGTKTVTVDGTSVGTNATITTAGTGLQTVTLGGRTATNTVGGNLVVALVGGSYAFDADGTDVTGNVTVTTGGGTTASIDWATSNVTGTTTLINGAATTTLNEIIISGSTLTGNVIAKNGSATTTNAITVDGSTLSGKSSTLTNGPADTSNGISLGVTTTNTFAGLLTATNDAATLSGNNTITLSRGDLNGGANLSNTTVGASVASLAVNNTVTIGDVAAVTITGNLVVTNAAATTQNLVNIDRLTVDGVKAGNVTINNGAVSAGTTSVIFGAAAAANDIDGNLTIRNQATSGLRTVTLDDLDVGGTTGAYIYNVGAGNTDYNIGVAGATNVIVTALLKIEDGSGSADIEVNNATLGAFTYTDIGGGTDALDIATVANAAVTINGVTRIDTANGSDDVTISTNAGTSVFNDHVYIALGSGNDDLLIGGTASSPAFTTANDLMFDGGPGTDTVSVNPLSIADYELSGNGLTKKLKQKIKNFETYSVNAN